MQTALVTGASGFIGSTLVESLAREGIRVKALLRATSSRKNLGALKEGSDYELAEGSLSDESSLARACAGVDVVYHLAGVTAGPNREFYLEHNARGAGRLAKAAAATRGAKLTRFVLVSSLAAGGPSAFGAPRREADPDSPVSAYGVSKLDGEQEVLQYRDQIPITIIRPPMVYGPKDQGVFVIIKTLASGLNLLLPSAGANPHKEYSLIHADDLVRGILLAGRAKVPSGEVFYLSDGGVHSYPQLTQAILTGLGRAALGRKRTFTMRVPLPLLSTVAHVLTWIGERTARNYPLNTDKLNEILPDAWTCSTEKARDQLGFSPQVALGDGMIATIRWYRNQGWLK